jgi:hypothetical protein
VFDGVESAGNIALNGQPLGSNQGDAQARFDLTSRLAERNELVVDVSSGESAPGGLVGEVRLEIIFDPGP